MKSLILLFALAFSGCATYRTAVVSVDSIADQNKGPTNFVIVPANERQDPTDLHFKEYAVFTARALEAKGFSHEINASTDHLTVTLDYGVGIPQRETVTRRDPVYAPSQTTTETNSRGEVVHETTTSTNGPIAYDTYYEQITNYDKSIKITGYQDINKKRVMKWQTQIDNVDQSPDLRGNFVLMLRGALPHLAENTGALQTQVVSIPDDDKGLCYIRYGERCDLKTGKPKAEEEITLK